MNYSVADFEVYKAYRASKWTLSTGQTNEKILISTTTTKGRSTNKNVFS